VTMRAMTPRAPTTDERAFLEAVLAHSFDGVEALRDQWGHASVEPSCECGCGSIGFVFDAEFRPRRSTAPNPLPIEGDIVDADGALVGGIIVLVREGVLDDVDVHSYVEHPLSFPPMSLIRLRR
jgi:hypothetical protein